MKTTKGNKIPVTWEYTDREEYNALVEGKDVIFDKNKHRCHFDECPAYVPKLEGYAGVLIRAKIKVMHGPYPFSVVCAYPNKYIDGYSFNRWILGAMFCEVQKMDMSKPVSMPCGLLCRAFHRPQSYWRTWAGILLDFEKDGLIVKAKDYTDTALKGKQPKYYWALDLLKDSLVEYQADIELFAAPDIISL